MQKPVKPKAIKSTTFVMNIFGLLSLERLIDVAKKAGLTPDKVFIDVDGEDSGYQLCTQVLVPPSDFLMQQYREQLAAYNKYLKTGVDPLEVGRLKNTKANLEADLRAINNKLDKLTKPRSKKAR